MMTREKAIRHIKNAINVPNDLGLTVIDIESLYEALTWTEPVRRGHWVGIDDYPYETWECDQCGYIHEELGGWVPRYCPDCGAKMEEDE